VAATKRREVANQYYLAFAAGDRSFFEQRLSEEFVFSAPPDPRLGRDEWFQRCWPGAGRGQEFDFVRLIECGDEVIVTYELRRADGSAARNTEILGFGKEDMLVRAEVYFGWNVT
jgi:hypothetical protein